MKKIPVLAILMVLAGVAAAGAPAAADEALSEITFYVH
jgi:ABC-type glycerol-3-phosphate transport system substrate-binding protein